MQAVVATALPPSVIASVNAASPVSVSPDNGFQLALKAVQAVAGMPVAAPSALQGRGFWTGRGAPPIDPAEQTAASSEVVNQPNPSPAGGVIGGGLARRARMGRKADAKGGIASNAGGTSSAATKARCWQRRSCFCCSSPVLWARRGDL